MLDQKKLKASMILKGYSGEKLAKEIGMAPKTFYRKFKTGNFGADEIMTISDKLEIEDIAEIFFAKEIS